MPLPLLVYYPAVCLSVFPSFHQFVTNHVNTMFLKRMNWLWRYN